MILLRLLTTGKSLVGVRDAESRYRLPSQRLLPQFGPVRNPFGSGAKAELAQTEARPPEDHGGNGTPAARPSLPGPGGEPAAVLQPDAEHCAAPAKFDARNLAGALWRRATALLSGWQAKLCGLLALSGRQAAQPAIPRFPKPPVQGELSLDRIKVVRNDLSDADLEVVPAKPPAAPVATAPAPRAVEKAEGAKSAWGRVTTRIWGGGKTPSDEDR
ncbi:MAG: hypothetical protein ABSD29_02395 [Verrucomicrobiota bacterium]|jgi:hypothetical protein